LPGTSGTGFFGGIVGGFLVAALFIVVMWTLKFSFVKLSLRRCPPDPLLTPVGTDFLDLFRDSLQLSAGTGSQDQELSWKAQLGRIPVKSWLYLAIAAASWIRIEWLWPLMLLCLVLFARSLRKLL
jgi:hypothetical protein